MTRLICSCDEEFFFVVLANYFPPFCSEASVLPPTFVGLACRCTSCASNQA